jgi:hypothetical protein
MVYKNYNTFLNFRLTCGQKIAIHYLRAYPSWTAQYVETANSSEKRTYIPIQRGPPNRRQESLLVILSVVRQIPYAERGQKSLFLILMLAVDAVYKVLCKYFTFVQ